MRSRFFDQATLLKEEGVRTKEFFLRRGSLDPLSEAHALAHQPQQPPSVRFLRAFRFFHLTDPNALATALSSNHLTSQELDLLVSAACALTSIGSVKDDAFDFILNSKGVSASRISLIHEASKDFDFLHAAADFSVSDGVLDLCDGETSAIFNALISFGFTRRIDRILIVASAIEKFDDVIARYDKFPIPISSMDCSFPEFLARTYASLVSRIGEYAKSGVIPFDPDLLDLLESRFDPELILSSKPLKIPSEPLPRYFSKSPIHFGQLVGYRGIDFDLPQPHGSPEYRLLVLLCTCLALSCGNAVPHPQVLQALSEALRPLKVSNPKRED